MTDDKVKFIKPNWPAPDHIKAFTTTRIGGISQPPFSTFNMADHVGDDPDAVLKNRHHLKERLKCPTEPFWLNQIHGNRIISPADESPSSSADGAYSLNNNNVSVVMTADCLPLLITDKAGKMVMALHGGWRSLAAGIIEKGIARFKKFNFPAIDLLVWLGPAIGPDFYEVGQEVKDQFIKNNPLTETAFVSSNKRSHQGSNQHADQHWLMDIYAVAKVYLTRCGVTEIYGGDHCTYKENRHFFSYRRDGKTGRMASLIWIASRTNG